MANPESRSNVAADILKRSASVAFFLVFFAILAFLAAGRLAWIWVWVYLGINLLGAAIVGPITIRNTPETVAERGRMKVSKTWDTFAIAFHLLACYVALPLAAGLNVRFGWARDLGIAWHVAAATVYAAGSGLSAWAMIVNTYFSCTVRLQSDRGHAVCGTGPYRFVRHPGYVGIILESLSLPIMLGSFWALVCGIAAAASIVIRTVLEDRLLQAELPGYPEYARAVRYRLVPGMW